MRLILISTVLAIAVASGCRSSSKADQAAKSTTRESPEQQVLSRAGRDTGKTIARGESRYAIIQDSACEGTRVANTRFEATRGLIVRITEDNTQLGCSEGILSRPLVLVWHEDRPSAPPDTIHPSGASITIVSGGTNSHTVPLLDGVEDEGGIGPSLHAYYSLLTGKQLFISEPPIQMFVANGTRRYISVRGGNKDTAVVVEYGSGATPPQVLNILAGPNPPWGRDPILSVDTVSFEGPPKTNGEIILGPDNGKDSVAVSGLTLRFRAGDVSSGFAPDDAKLSYVVKIANDRLVLEK